jgi:hypothetical protein
MLSVKDATPDTGQRIGIWIDTGKEKRHIP